MIKKHPNTEILKECGRNMIEFGCYPSINTYNPALEIIESMMLLRSGRGFRYANINIPYQFNDNPGVASTAWFVIAVRIMTDRDVNNLFWGK